MSAIYQHCANKDCKQAHLSAHLLDDAIPEGWIGLKSKGLQLSCAVCSPSCLVEFAWWLKENQTKLSKSKAQSE